MVVAGDVREASIQRLGTPRTLASWNDALTSSQNNEAKKLSDRALVVGAAVRRISSASFIMPP